MVMLIAPQSSFHERTGAQFRRGMKSRQIRLAPVCNNLKSKHLLPQKSDGGIDECVEPAGLRKAGKQSLADCCLYRRGNIEEGIESAHPAGWPVMGLQTSESGGALPAVKS